MKGCVIGAGPSGLIAAKSLSDAGIDWDLFEASDDIGGTWVYVDNFINKHGLPVHTSSYKNLRTNLPKELMLFEGLNYDVEGVSFIHSSDVLDYLKKFAVKFDVYSKIKFEHLVSKVSWNGESWDVYVKNLPSGIDELYHYDAVFVCNGHYSIPNYPEICGGGSFPGSAVHSHFYKVPESYRDKVVLVTGIGPSSVDIVYDIAPYAKQIYLSHHGPDSIKRHFPQNVIHKPDVKYIDGSLIHFLDDSEAHIEAIIYCSGYNYGFPFLDTSCGIKVESNYVQPLYKQFVSIPHSSMFFIGLPHRTFLFQLFELQVKCAINILTGKVKLPEKTVMEDETLAWEESLTSRGLPKRRFHCIAGYVREYFDDIADLGGLKRLPDVLFEIYMACDSCRKSDLANYKNKVFVMNGDEYYKSNKLKLIIDSDDICPDDGGMPLKRWQMH